MSRWLSLLAIIIVVVIGLSFFNRARDEDMGPQATPQQPGWYLQDAVMIETQPDGTPRVKIAASVIQQDAARDTIDMTNVRVDYFGAAPRHWLLTADRGHVPGEATQRVQFAGDVEVEEVGGTRTPKIRTERLALDMKRDLATSDAPVNVLFGTHSLSARGLRADLNAESLRLESEINGRFQPQK